MSGIGGQGIGSGGRSERGSRGRNRGIGQYIPTLNKNEGLFSSLGNNIFDYGQKGAADQMRTTRENIVHHVGTIYKNDISKKPKNKTKVSISNPEYTEYVQLKQKKFMELLKLQSARLSEARESKKVMLSQAIEYGNDSEIPTRMAILKNDTDEATYKA